MSNNGAGLTCITNYSGFNLLYYCEFFTVDQTHCDVNDLTICNIVYFLHNKNPL